MVQLAESGDPVDVVFMDPPRTGSDERFLESLARLRPRRVVYISCNPETLVRDLKYLTGKGFEVKKAMGVDMFPFTVEMECVCLLSSRESRCESKDRCGSGRLLPYQGRTEKE